MTRLRRPTTAWQWSLWVMRVAVAAGLAIEAYVHLDLASLYGEESGGTISEGVLFRTEAGLALLAAVAVLAFGRRWVSYLAALVVAGSDLVLMLVARYNDLGQFGPFPDLYDPQWFPEKLLAAYADSAASVIALAAIIGVFLAGKSWHGTGEKRSQ